MKILTLTCNRCGESLEVQEETRFLTCTACLSQLEVHRSGSTIYTEVLESTETSKLELELEKIDRDWVEERESHGSVPRLKLHQCIGQVALPAGFGLACLGGWLHSLGNDARLERLLHPWPGVCMVLGVFLVVGWAVFFLSTGNDRSRIAEYNWAAQSCGYRRQRLLQAIAASKAKGNAREDDDQSVR